MENDLHNDINDVLAFQRAQLTNGTVDGVIIDTNGYESIEFIVTSDTVTDGTHTVVLQDGDNSGLSDAANVAAGLTLGTLPSFGASDDNTVKRVGCISKKRYVRLSIVTTGATTGGGFSGVAIQGHPRVSPVAQ